MLRISLITTLFLVQTLFAGKVQIIANLPSGAIPKSLRVDASGGIYIAGSIPPQSPKSSADSFDAFVAKLSPDGATVLFFQTLAGSAADSANALALGSDGSIYVAGTSSSSDLPSTAGALQTAPGPQQGGQAFLAKLNPAGAVVYLTYLGGAASTTGVALAVDSAGEAYVTGDVFGTGFSPTPGAIAGSAPGYVMKVDATGSKLLLATYGFGGSLIALDAQNNIYVAGTSSQPPLSTDTLATAGAFQTSSAILVANQYVEKADPTGTTLLYATYLSGSLGATPAAIAVDASGNVIVAGTTNSQDYPVTADAFQSEYLAAAQPPAQLPFPLEQTYPPPSTGYATKLNATGSALIWSTFFGGSSQDAISGMAVDADSNIYLAGAANSADLPGIFASPAPCRPSVNQELGFVGRLSADGSAAAPTQLIYGAPSCTYASCAANASLTSSTSWLVAPLTDGTTIVVGQNGAVAEANLFAPTRVVCMADPADNVQLSYVTPGQLLALYGTSIPPLAPGSTPNGVTVTFNGIAAPLLYTDGEQINLQVPYEVAGNLAVEVRVMFGKTLVDSRSVPVVAQQPAIMLSTTAYTEPPLANSPCGTPFREQINYAPQALALNADGTLNSCSNPAAAGSLVTLFLNGLGVTTPALATGALGPVTPLALLPAVSGNGAVATTTLPGVSDGLAGVTVRVPVGSMVPLNLSVNGVPTRQPTVVIFVN